MRAALLGVRVIEMCGAGAWILRKPNKRVRLRMTEEKKKGNWRREKPLNGYGLQALRKRKVQNCDLRAMRLTKFSFLCNIKA